MKTNFKNIVTVLAVLTTVSFATISKADDALVLPVISRPSVLQEGTQKVLTPAQIADLLPWAKDSKVFLIDLLASTEGLASDDKVDQLITGIQSVVGDSAPKNSELLMRYVLNRGVIIKGILDQEMDAKAPGTVDAKIRVLTSSVKMAITYYDSDLKTMTKKTAAPYAGFGYDYFMFLSELNKSIFDASAQYNIFRTSFEWFQWDLYRDLNNTSFAPQIIKINNSLKLFPVKKLTDFQSINYVRQMKGLAKTLDIRAALNAIGQNQRGSQTNTDEQNGNQFNSSANAIQVITNPKLNNFLFSTLSNLTGVCIAMGYQKVVPGDIKKDGDIYGVALIVNSTGSITSSQTIDEANGATITEITCANKTNNQYDSKVIVQNVVNPKSNGQNISSLSNLTGICRSAGFSKALEGSLIKTGDVYGTAFVLDVNGNVTSTQIVDESNGATVVQVTCIK